MWSISSLANSINSDLDLNGIILYNSCMEMYLLPCYQHLIENGRWVQYNVVLRFLFSF
jgi:hypothetical protein